MFFWERQLQRRDDGVRSDVRWLDTGTGKQQVTGEELVERSNEAAATLFFGPSIGEISSET